MTSYQCNNGHTFNHPAKQVIDINYPIQSSLQIVLSNIEDLYNIKTHPNEPENYRQLVNIVKDLSKIVDKTPDYFDLEVYVCPFCQSKEYTEAPPVTEEIESVYIYDLTSGPQTALDALLAQGYVIVNRYSKQYHLEKPKSAPKDANPETEALP